MSNFNDKIDNKRGELYLQRFTNEINHLKDSEQEADTERVEKLEEIIKSLQQTQPKNSNNIDSYFNNIDKHIYTKPWNRLPIFHRIEKMKEFIKENVEDDYEHKEKLVSELTQLLSEKKLNTKKYVDYDSTECKIVDFSTLKFEKDGTYQLKS